MATNSAGSVARQLFGETIHYLRFSTTYSDTGISTGVSKQTLPAGAIIIGTDVLVSTTYNAQTTNVLTVGVNGTTANNIVASGDVDETTAALTQNVKKRVWEKVMTRCVDPTDSMKATFSSKSVGSCVSTQPQKSGNTYTFARRCDYMGPVSTVITVHTQDSYTEINELTVGKYPRTDLVVARRVGDCHG